MAIPTVEECRSRLKLTADRLPDEELADILAGEVESQAKVCRIPAASVDPEVDTFPVALRNALFRRVQRAIAMKALPLAVMQGDAEQGPLRLSSHDAEVRRLEGPFRIVVFA